MIVYTNVDNYRATGRHTFFEFVHEISNIPDEVFDLIAVAIKLFQNLEHSRRNVTQYTI